VLEDWKETQYGKIDFAFMPIGGGGMASGICSYLSQMTPSTTLVGVEPLVKLYFNK
jgi:threonine dehydratase